MKIMSAAVTGLLCFTTQGAKAQSFEQQVLEISQKTSVMAQQTRHVMAAATAPGGTVNPTDALDEAIVGIAATFVRVKAGTFEMGSPPEEEDHYDDEILHRVTLTNDFEMQATEVTQLQFFLVTGRNPSSFWKEEDCDKDNFRAQYGRGLCANHPVENVEWNSAQKFIEALNKSQSRYTYRLPTEAEWEYAARGGMPSGSPYSFGGKDKLGDYGWYDGNSGERTHAVASKKANPYGLYDMHGNAQEWTQDWSGDYPQTAVTDPTGPTTGSKRVFRGGSWGSLAGYLRSASRLYAPPNERYFDWGFRLVRSRR